MKEREQSMTGWVQGGILLPNAAKSAHESREADENGLCAAFLSPSHGWGQKFESSTLYSMRKACSFNKLQAFSF